MAIETVADASSAGSRNVIAIGGGNGAGESGVVFVRVVKRNAFDSATVEFLVITVEDNVGATIPNIADFIVKGKIETRIDGRAIGDAVTGRGAAIVDGNRSTIAVSQRGAGAT